jgi:hypothetical protein
MKCSHPTCNRAIGLVSHRRWFDRGLYCTRSCRDNYASARSKRASPQSADAKLFAWLFAPSGEHAAPRLVPAAVRARARKI